MRSIEYSNSHETTERLDKSLLFSARTAELLNLTVLINLILQKKIKSIFKRGSKDISKYAIHVYYLDSMRNLCKKYSKRKFINALDKVRIYQKRKNEVLVSTFFRLSKTYTSLLKVTTKILCGRVERHNSLVKKHFGVKTVVRMAKLPESQKISKVYSPVHASAKTDYFVFAFDKQISECKEDDFVNFDQDPFYLKLEEEYEKSIQ